MATNFEPHECVIFAQSTKIGTHENKAIHSITKKIKYWYWLFQYDTRMKKYIHLAKIILTWQIRVCMFFFFTFEVPHFKVRCQGHE